MKMKEKANEKLQGWVGPGAGRKEGLTLTNWKSNHFFHG